jgi:hypothetical protein
MTERRAKSAETPLWSIAAHCLPIAAARTVWRCAGWDEREYLFVQILAGSLTFQGTCPGMHASAALLPVGAVVSAQWGFSGRMVKTATVLEPLSA